MHHDNETAKLHRDILHRRVFDPAIAQQTDATSQLKAEGAKPKAKAVKPKVKKTADKTDQSVKSAE
jgi:hypothetical protein